MSLKNINPVSQYLGIGNSSEAASGTPYQSGSHWRCVASLAAGHQALCEQFQRWEASYRRHLFIPLLISFNTEKGLTFNLASDYMALNLLFQFLAREPVPMRSVPTFIQQN